MPTLQERSLTAVEVLEAAAQIQSDVSNGVAGATVTTEGGQVRTVANAIATLMATVPRGAWLTATAYVIRDLVTSSNVVYICVVGHTSGTFATDLAAGKWAVFSGPADEGNVASGFGRQRRRDTTANLAAFTGLAGEFSFDTSKKRLVAHDGATAGGFPHARQFRYNAKEWGCKGDNATDDTAALQVMIDAANTVYNATGIPVVCFLPAGIYILSNITVYPNVPLVGDCRFVTVLKGKTGSTGKMITENGTNAAKIIISDFDIYANNCNYSAVIDLGSDGGDTQFGTEGYLRNIWIRDCPNYALKIVGNVAIIDTISIWGAGQTGGTAVSLLGEANHAKCILMAGYAGCIIGDWAIHGLHLEAPDTNTIPLKIQNTAKIFGLSLATYNGGVATHSHLIEIMSTGGSGYWLVHGLNTVVNALTTITNGNFKDSDGVYFGGNATGGGNSADGSYSYKTVEVSGNSFLKRMKRQSFMLRIYNDAGTFKHKIGIQVPDNITGNFCDKITGATAAAYTATPTGADASTAMAGGGKIGTVDTNSFWLDCAAQIVADFVGTVHMVYNNTTTAINVNILLYSKNINGVTRVRPALFFSNATTGANYVLSTLPSGALIDIRFDGYLY